MGVFHGRKNAVRNSFNCPNCASGQSLLTHPDTHTHCRCIHSNHSVYTMLHCQPPVNPISQSSSWPTVRNQNDFRSSFYMALERVGCIDLSNPPIIHEEGRYVALFFLVSCLLLFFIHLGVVLTSPAKCESANWLQIIKDCKIIYLTVEGKLLTLILIRSCVHL